MKPRGEFQDFGVGRLRLPTKIEFPRPMDQVEDCAPVYPVESDEIEFEYRVMSFPELLRELGCPLRVPTGRAVERSKTPQ